MVGKVMTSGNIEELDGTLLNNLYGSNEKREYPSLDQSSRLKEVPITGPIKQAGGSTHHWTNQAD